MASSYRALGTSFLTAKPSLFAALSSSMDFWTSSIVFFSKYATTLVFHLANTKGPLALGAGALGNFLIRSLMYLIASSKCSDGTVPDIS